MREKTMRSLRFRLLAGALLCLVLALGSVNVVLSSLFSDHTYGVLRDQLRNELDALTAALDWTGEGKLVVSRQLADPRFETAYSGRYWQVRAEGVAPLVSRSLWDALLEMPAAGREAGDESLALTGPHAAALIALRRTVVLAERATPVTIVVTTPRQDWLEKTERFDRLLAISLAATGVALFIASLLQIVFGLLPLKRLEQSVARLRADHRNRLAGDWPLEVRPLVDEIEALLDRDVAMLQRARRQAGDLAHAIKTPLAALANEAQAHPHDPFAREVTGYVETIRQQLERQLARARAAGRAIEGAPGTIDVVGVGEGLVRAMKTLYMERELDIRLDGAGCFSGDAQDLAEMLGNVLDNACKWAASRVRLSIGRQDRFVLLAVDDDGPGIPEGRECPRGDAPLPLDETRHGSGLGLRIVEDIVALYGGQVRYGRSALGGLQVVLQLPGGEVADEQ